MVSEVRPNAIVDIPVPDAVRQATTPYTRGTAQKMAKGGWHLTGGTHHSAVIEMLYHVIVAESPLNDDCALAVIAEVKRLVPNKPLCYAANTASRPYRAHSRRYWPAPRLNLYHVLGPNHGHVGLCASAFPRRPSRGRPPRAP